MTARASNGQRPRKEKATEPTDRVGSFEMRVEAAEVSAQAADRWTHRSEVLAAWLLAEWRREQGTEAAS